MVSSAAGALFFSALGAGTAGLSNWIGAKVLSDADKNYDANTSALAGVIGGAIFGAIEGLIAGPMISHLFHDDENDDRANKCCLLTTFSGLIGIDVLAGLTGQGILSKLGNHTLNANKQAAAAATGIGIEMAAIAGFIFLTACCFCCYVTRCATDKQKERKQLSAETSVYGAL